MLQPETSRFICRIRARELISIGRQPILQTLAQQGDTGSLLRSLGPQGLRHPARCLPDQQASLDAAAEGGCMRKPLRALVIGAVAALLALPIGTAQALNADTLVTVGSPSSPFSPNKQNEPAVAIDANHPTLLA